MKTEVAYADGTLTVSRVYAAPRELVFEAWIETSKVAEWWGCADATDVVADIEPRVGGAFNHSMTVHGQPFPSHGVITAYDPPTHLAWDDPHADQSFTVDFVEVHDGTKVVLVHNGIPDEVAHFVDQGWSASFEKLDTVLAAATG